MPNAHELAFQLDVPDYLKGASFKDSGWEDDPVTNAAFTLLGSDGTIVATGKIEFHEESDFSNFDGSLSSPFGKIPVNVVFEGGSPSLDGLVSVAVSLEGEREALPFDQLRCRLTVEGQQFVSPADVDRVSLEQGDSVDCVFISWEDGDGQSRELILPKNEAQLRTVQVEFFLQG